MTETKTPEVWWSPSRGLLRRVGDELRGPHAVLDEPPADAVRLISEDAAAADALVRQARLKGMTIDEGAVELGLESPRELMIAWVWGARAMLGDAPNYSETRVDFPSASMTVKAAGEIDRYVLTVQRAGKLTPHEARQAAEAERDRLRSELAEEKREHLRTIDDALRVKEAWTAREQEIAAAAAVPDTGQARPHHLVTSHWDAAGGEVLYRSCTCGEEWARDEDRCPEDDIETLDVADLLDRLDLIQARNPDEQRHLDDTLDALRRELAEPAGDTVQAPDVTALLRFAAAGRREYATNAPADQAAALESAAATFDQAARIASGDVNSLRFAVPSRRWDEADALLGTDADGPLTGQPLAGDPGLPLSALFDNRDPHQDEMRAGTDTAEPGPVYVKPDEELPHA